MLKDKSHLHVHIHNKDVILGPSVHVSVRPTNSV